LKPNAQGHFTFPRKQEHSRFETPKSELWNGQLTRFGSGQRTRDQGDEPMTNDVPSKQGRVRDVFVCFSKSKPGEARVALALKDELRQVGLFAHEYEDWVGDTAVFSGAESAADRKPIHQTLANTAVAVLIAPHDGNPTPGVETELRTLREGATPTILLRWSPKGSHPLLAPSELGGLNIVWTLEGHCSEDGDVTYDQSMWLARQLAIVAWVACLVGRFQNHHPNTIARLLNNLEEEPGEPLRNLRLSEVQVAASGPRPAFSVDQILQSATHKELEDFVSEWRSGTDLMTVELLNDAKFSLVRVVERLLNTCEASSSEVESRFGSTRSSPCLVQRAVMLIRLSREPEAIVTLREALDVADGDERWEIHLKLGLAQMESDPLAAIESFTQASAAGSDLSVKCICAYNRGAIYCESLEDFAHGITDFSFVLSNTQDPKQRNGALRGRALAFTETGNFDAAIADYTALIQQADMTPRIAVSAWMDRGALYQEKGNLNAAVADWTLAIRSADAEEEQRFTTLKARGEALEQLGQFRAAAEDFQTLAEYSNTERKFRESLLARVKELTDLDGQP
jgi:tetratricopeptide (TPR) repeat protein